MKIDVVPCSECNSRRVHMKGFTKTCRDCGLHVNRKKAIVVVSDETKELK